MKTDAEIFNQCIQADRVQELLTLFRAIKRWGNPSVEDLVTRQRSELTVRNGLDSLARAGLVVLSVDRDRAQVSAFYKNGEL